MWLRWPASIHGAVADWQTWYPWSWRELAMSEEGRTRGGFDNCLMQSGLKQFRAIHPPSRDLPSRDLESTAPPCKLNTYNEFIYI